MKRQPALAFLAFASSLVLTAPVGAQPPPPPGALQPLPSQLPAPARQGASTLPPDCARYLTQAQRLNADVQALITQALEQGRDVSGAACLFRSDEWSIREEKHRAWCATENATGIEARLAKMSRDIAACSAQLNSRGNAEEGVAANGRNGDASRNSVSTAGNGLAGVQTVSFDRAPTGALTADTLQLAGARVAEAQGEPRVYDSDASMVLPSGRSRVLLVAGGRTTSLTLAFDAPLKRFALTRIGTANGASTPTWRLEAFDGNGALVAATGEERGLPAQPQRFSVAAAGIVRVVLTTDNRFGDSTWATWSSLPIVELEVER